MKKSLFMLPLLALAFASCSSDEPANNDGTQPGEAKYLSINIVATPTNGSKADPVNNNQYEDGVGKENTVSTVRFYFFDAAKEAAMVKKNGENLVNYYDWTNPSTGDGDKPNVEKVINAQLIINTQEGDKEPVSVVAIINPTSDLPAGSLSLQQLNEKVEAYDNTESFIMSNSVYEDTGMKMEEVSVAGHLYTAAAAAIANPVTIHVERVLAKVTMNLKEGLANNGLIATGKTSEVLGESDNDVYVKFLGWNVTATTDKSRLMKEINVSWPKTLFGGEPWNWTDFYRSFWAINPAGLNYVYGTFNVEDEGNPNLANAVTSFDGGFTYLQENAAASSANDAVVAKPSQVIVAAQLVDKAGKAVEIAEWGFKQYKVADLKKAILASLTNRNLFKKTEALGGGTEYKQISVDDLDFKTASAVDGNGNLVEKGRYYVYSQLSDDAGALEWVDANDGTGNKVEVSTINSALKDLGHAKIWTSGYTYYYLNIRHLGDTADKPGYYGVVRNHVYKVLVNSLSGLGTPVYDPTEVIIPEKPGNEETFIAAEIKILSWRIVNNVVDFDW